MGRWKQMQRYFFIEPAIWLLRSFFQPAGFMQDIETRSLPERMLKIVRLLVPLFVFSFPLALTVRVLCFAFVPALFDRYGIVGPAFLSQGTVDFVWDCIWGVAVSCVGGGFFGGLFGVSYGISIALACALANGVIISTTDDTFVGIMCGLAFGLLLGLTFNTIGSIRRSGLLQTTVGIMLGCAVGILVGVPVGIFAAYWPGLLVGMLGGPQLLAEQSILGSVAGFIVGGTFASSLVRLTGILVRGTLQRSRRGRYIEMIDVGTRIGIVVAAAFGAAVGVPVGDAGMSHLSLSYAISAGAMQGLVVGVAFVLSYIPSYYRLPLYPFSSLAMVRTHFKCQRDPLNIFYYLRHSALHYDEAVFLPLPYLKQALLLAAEQNVEEAIEESEFVIHERPQQRGQAQAALVEIALSDLSMRESLRDISRAYQRLGTILSQEIRFLDPQMAKLFSNLEDASRDAASYYTRVNGQARHEALASMIANLRKIYPSTAFRDAVLNRHLEEIVQKWQAVARHEQDNIENMPGSFGRIDNPYTPGLALELRNPLFVGRDDVAQQLSEALRRSRRPTFFLTGERRMGKSSILKQLPVLLGSQYLSVFYDLQSTGVASSIAAMLAAIAEGVYDLLTTKGILIKRLEYEQLREDQRENEAVAYHRFDRWMRDVERLLEQNDRVLLLAFDEFEKLEEAGQRGHIDLHSLLDWFRSVIQNRPRLALLFSGVKTMSEMGSSWAGYFVNVETLKVSFLRPEEARLLIAQPTPQFPGERIFGAQVIAEVLRVSGYHPFLIQALCSILIAELNASGREQAVLHDVEAAIEEVFKKWGDNYFKDLWERTDRAQRLCLDAVYALGEADPASIQLQSGLDEMTTRLTLQKLLKRDILLVTKDCYRFAAPIFAEWFARSI
jgi:AAA ATPase domain